jgi:hypothetical protein
MTYSINEMESIFFRYLIGELPIKDFEQWIYSTPELEGYLGGSAYFDFISFNFQQPSASSELSKLIVKYFAPTKFLNWKFKRLLRGLLDGTLDPVEVFENLYDMYCKGYQFLDHLAIQYLLWIEETPKLTAQHFWDKNEFFRHRKMLDSYVDSLKDEIETLLQALESGEIELINEKEYSVQPELIQKLQNRRQVFEYKGSQQSVQDADKIASESPFTQVSNRKPSIRAVGKITFNEKWNLTPRIKGLLEQLVKFGVDIYSSRGESDYTFLVPSYLPREEYEEVERLMKEVGKAVRRKVNYIDWYPHGTKFRIEGPKARSV